MIAFDDDMVFRPAVVAVTRQNSPAAIFLGGSLSLTTFNQWVDYTGLVSVNHAVINQNSFPPPYFAMIGWHATELIGAAASYYLAFMDAEFR
jgi:hypothetical protein